MIEVFVESIRVNMANYKRVVMLKDRETGRYLPIWIGHFEADAIAIPMQKVSVNRPLTHDLLWNSIKELGGRLEHIVIHNLEDETFFARLVVYQAASGKTLEVDARPSDAIALAIRAEVPIFVEDKVLESAGISLDTEEEEGAPERRKPREESTPVDEEKLGIFKDFIATLPIDLDDPDKGAESK